MRIGIDGYNLAMPNGTGVATYGLSLARMLQGMDHRVDGIFGLEVGREPETRELLFYDAIERERRLKRADRWRHIYRQLAKPWQTIDLLPVPISDKVEKRGFREKLPEFSRIFSFPWLFELAHARLERFGSFLTVRVPDPPDIMHWTYPLPIRMLGTRNIYTIHDLVPLRLPYTTLDDKRLYHSMVKQCVINGDHVCTVSESSRDDILSRFACPPEKVTNTYQVSPLPDEVAQSSPEEDAAMVKGLFGLERKGFFLFFGALDPKKNIDRMLDAYQTSGAKMPLVVVLARDWGMGKGHGSGRDPFAGRDGNRIIRLNYLSRSMLFRLIRTARAVAFPSLFEGFGLPAFEAIQLGTPVIASNVSSLPEVVGNAGLQVDPYSVADIAKAFSRMERDEVLYKSLIAKGPEQVAKFSETNYRKRLAAMYDTVIASGRNR
jgi:glycosyltransferase involved in cell wall biosynthesis